MDDKRIIAAIKDDDERGIAEIYKNHLTGIISMVLKNSGSRVDAEEIEQQTVIILYEKIKKGEFELNVNTKLNTYLFSVANNLWKRELRGKKKLLFPEDYRWEDIVEDEEAIPISAKTQTQKIAISTLDKLNETCKNLLNFFYFEKLSLKEIAVKLGIASVQTAKSKRYKCFQQYKKMVLTELATNK